MEFPWLASCMQALSWVMDGAVKHVVTGLWSHGDMFSGLTNNASLSGSLMDKPWFGEFQESATCLTWPLSSSGGKPRHMGRICEGSFVGRGGAMCRWSNTFVHIVYVPFLKGTSTFFHIHFFNLWTHCFSIHQDSIWAVMLPMLQMENLALAVRFKGN